MKLAARIALALGVAAMVVIIVREGGPSILTLLGEAGWVLLLLVPLHALPIGLDVLGWRTLIVRLTQPPRFATLLWIAAVREAINRLLPVASIGGEIAGIRLLANHDVEGTDAAASVVVEVLLTLVSQYLFVTLGVVLVLKATHGTRALDGLVLGLGIALVAITAMFALLRYGSVFERLEQWVQRMIGVSRGARLNGWLGASGASPDAAHGSIAACGASVPVTGRGWQQLDATIRELCIARRLLALAAIWQLAGFVASSLEIWLTLRWFDHPIDFDASIALESLTLAVRQFAFLVPAGLGVQEAGLIGFGSLFGLTPDVAVTLSLVKRMRELLFGVPALASWQWSEGWRGLPRKT
ncbi:MAG: lysylphosphatidylglycerol synthase domain-containing protein [Steroidobacteraceae bacterium]